VSHQRLPRWRHTLALATVMMSGPLITSCTSEDAPSPSPPTKGTSLAQCRSYGVPSAPVTLKLPGMVFYAAVADARNAGWTPGTALLAYDEQPRGGSATVSVTLFVAAASSAPDRIQEGMWKANIGESSRWGVDIVARGAIAVSAVADTTGAAKVSHSTFTTHHGSASATFDYWAFSSGGQRYLLSYARTPAAKTPNGATFFATATSCPKAAT
jgi:hypothetical protein